MTDKQTPPDWVLIEAAKRCGWGCGLASMRNIYRDDVPFRALCDILLETQQPPVDPVVTAIIEAMYDLADGRSGNSSESYAACLRNALASRGFEIRERKQ